MTASLTCVALWFVPAPSNNYLQAIQDKLSALDTVAGARIILVGGSSAAFGFNSAEIADATQRRVINTGIHAGVGLNFMLRSVIGSVRAGDLIIVSPEYDLFYPSKHSTTALYQILPYVANPDAYLGSIAESIEYRLQRPVQRLQRIFVYLLQRPFGLDHNDGIYRRDIFDRNGDIRLPANTVLGVDTTKFDRSLRTEALDETVFSELQNFSETATRRGATVFLMYPPRMSIMFLHDSSNVHAIEKRLQKVQRSGASIIGTAEDFSLPASYFFDTEYHLNPAGREVRTARVIELLREHAARLEQ